MDIIQSYYLGRLIDHHLQEMKENSANKQLTAHSTIQCIRRAEWEFEQTDFDNDIVQRIMAAGYSL